MLSMIFLIFNAFCVFFYFSQNIYRHIQKEELTKHPGAIHNTYSKNPEQNESLIKEFIQCRDANKIKVSQKKNIIKELKILF